MATVEVALGQRSYPVNIGPGLLGECAAWQPWTQGRKVLVISNEVVAPLYLDRLGGSLDAAQLHTLVLPDGETGKNAENWGRVIDRLVEARAGRDACVITLGGGVIGDLGGFAAATYMRGIEFIQAPTTLLAQVDASVGGKTGINHASGKNLIGAFHQPRAVFADTATLTTLPRRHFRAGLAEVVKYGAICDRAFLAWLEDHAADILALDAPTIGEMIEACVRHKAAVVATDELETGRRALLNFGHSFGHAIELLTGYRDCLHGEAVSIGMVIAAKLSEDRGLCPAGLASRLAALLTEFGLPVSLPERVSSTAMLEAMTLDKKNLGGQLRLILLRGPGQAVIDTGSSLAEVQAAIETCCS